MPNATDLYVGQRLREHRLMAGLSQQALGDKLGVSFQMVQKYEKGTCRISASTLHQAAQILGIAVQRFFPLSTP